MKNKENLRTFISIDFPSQVIKEVARIQHTIHKNTLFTGKLTELENLHITLKFLGSIPQSTLEKVKEKLSHIKFPTLDLSLHSCGTFNFKGKPKIAWIRVTGNIFMLQKKIDESLKDLFKPEARFMSHLTIARIKHTKNPKQFQEYISNIKPKPINFQINSFKLMSSQLKSPGPIYSTIQEYQLQD